MSQLGQFWLVDKLIKTDLCSCGHSFSFWMGASVMLHVLLLQLKKKVMCSVCYHRSYKIIGICVCQHCCALKWLTVKTSQLTWMVLNVAQFNSSALAVVFRFRWDPILWCTFNGSPSKQKEVKYLITNPEESYKLESDFGARPEPTLNQQPLQLHEARQ